MRSRANRRASTSPFARLDVSGCRPEPLLTTSLTDMGVRDLPPRGFYLAQEVGRLAGVSGRTIGQWARRGYIRSSQSDGSPRVYSYQDIAEAMVVHALLEAHVGHRGIKDAIERLRTESGTAWPLTHAQLSVPTDHPRHVAGDKKKRQVIIGRPDRGVDATTGHPVLPDVDLFAIATDLRRGGWAARQFDLRHIEVDPERLSGRPTIAGHRIPAEDVARLAERKGGRRLLRVDYGLDRQEVDDAVRWWAAVTDYERAA
jgi:uncharacterized protein (DUF433 family)